MKNPGYRKRLSYYDIRGNKLHSEVAAMSLYRIFRECQCELDFIWDLSFRFSNLSLDKIRMSISFSSQWDHSNFEAIFEYFMDLEFCYIWSILKLESFNKISSWENFGMQKKIENQILNWIKCIAQTLISGGKVSSGFRMIFVQDRIGFFFIFAWK